MVIHDGILTNEHLRKRKNESPRNNVLIFIRKIPELRRIRRIKIKKNISFDVTKIILVRILFF